MDLQAVSGAATVAIACAIVFLLAARSWQLLSRVLSAHSSFADSIMSEAAQRFRDELSRLSRDQSTYLGTGLVFVVMYVAATAFNGPELFEGYPEWQLYLLLTTLVAAALFALYRLIRTVVAWRSVRFCRDANIAIGHELQRIAAGHGRAYHDVPTSYGVVDHVLVGKGGIYAVAVVARRHLKKGSASLLEGELHFSNTEKIIEIPKLTVSSRRLRKDLSKQVGRNLRVRTVVAVPGWEIEEQSDPDYLLVNERTLPMLRGWKDQHDYLMDEDVQALQDYLTRRCKRSAS
ncbi:MAG: hypothetical protein QNJ00_15025 [Woeseiaceae bacterium]|nr:hypothetical protein [Woeseiaceae bacterium]